MSRITIVAQNRFYNSEVCLEARKLLQALVDNPNYDTDSERYKQDPLSFVERHLHYLSTHSNIKLNGYISNLKLMIGADVRVS